MKRKVILVILFLFLVKILSGCKTVYVPVERVHTQYKDRIERDSIHILDSIHVREKGDTVWLTRWRTEFRDRVKVDSIFIQDSIPVPYPVEVIKTIEKELNIWQQVKMKTGGIGLLILFVVLILIAVKVWGTTKKNGWKGLINILFKR